MNTHSNNSFTKIYNCILDKISMTKLNGTQARIISVVWRYTYGWGRNEYEMSANFLADRTGIHVVQIKKELNVLIERKILVEVTCYTKRSARVLSFNQSFIDNSEVVKDIPGIEFTTSDGFSKIDNPILEEIAKFKLNGTQFRIITYLWRCTYGWSKDEYQMSITFISKATGIDVPQVQRELKKLIDRKIILVMENHTDSKGRCLSFNKYFYQKLEVVKSIPGTEFTTSTSTKSVSISGSESDTQNIKDKYKEIYEYYLDLEIIKHRKLTEPMINAMKKAENTYDLNVETMKRMLDRHKAKIVTTQHNGEFATRPRGLAAFFGQKKYGSNDLICAEYMDEYYQNSDDTQCINTPVIIKDTNTVI